MQTTNNLGLKKPGAEDVVNIEDLNSNSDALDGKFGASSGHGHTGVAGDGPKIGSNGLAAGAATDTVIGGRTVSDTTAPTGDSGTPTTLFGWLANMIKAITGGATWRTLPGMTIAAIKTILDAATNAGTASTLMKRDASGRAQVAAPSAAADIARKDTVDAVQSNLNTHTAVGNTAHGATSAPTVSTLMARDSAGRAQVVAPSVAADIANKGYVDTAVSGATIPDASLTVKGKVQLSSAVNSTSEVLAATPKAVKDAYDRGSAGVTAAAAAQAKADGALPKDGSAPMTGPLIAPRLGLTDYGTPMEIGRYIDLHKPGSSSDFDARITITDENQFRFEPAGGSGWELRNNGGSIEVNTGGGWIPVGGATYVASNTLREQNTAEYIPIPSSASYPYYSGILAYKFVPKCTGEIVVTCDARGYSWYDTSASSSDDYYWVYYDTGIDVYVPSVQAPRDGPYAESGNRIVPVGTLDAFDYRTPLGTAFFPTNIPASMARVARMGSSRQDNQYETVGRTLSVQAGIPIYFLTYGVYGRDGITINGAARYFRVKNLRIYYDIK